MPDASAALLVPPSIAQALGRRVRVAVLASAGLGFLERLAVVAATYEAVADRGWMTVALAAALAALFFARTVTRALLRVEIKTRLVRALAAALLDDAADVGDDAEDVEAPLLEGLYACETLVGDHVPELLGDAPACLCVGAVALATLPIRVVVEGGLVVLTGALVLLVARRVSARSADREWEAFGPLLDDLSVATRGGAELVASGEVDAFLGSQGARVELWRAAAHRASASSFAAGRAPALAVAVAAGLVWILDAKLRGVALDGVLGHAALLASMTPAFAGAARSWVELAKSRARTRPIGALLAGGSTVVAGGAAPDHPVSAIDVKGLSFAYTVKGGKAIEGLSTTFRPGEIVAIEGPNGSGKSTLLRLLVGVLRPTQGSVTASGVDLLALDARPWRRRLGYLAQRPFLPDRMTVRAAMTLIAPTADDAALARSLERVRLWPVLHARSPRAPLDLRVGALSAGERQRLALARVLTRGASVLLLDEPDANLDAEGLELLVTLLRELAPGRCVVLAAHSPRLLAAADRRVSLARLAPSAE